MKTKVELKSDDKKYGDYSKGDIGYIDGWIRGGDGVPYACVVIGEKIILCHHSVLRVISEEPS